MRLLLINSVYGFGSTGKICLGIVNEAQQNGDACMVGCREKRVSPNDNTKVVIIGGFFNLGIHGVLSRVFDDHGLHSVYSTKSFIEKAEKFNPDVLWLHNIHGYYINYELLFEWIKSRKNMKVKWTLHDCWAFTGHCTYFTMEGCDKWKYGCSYCPQLGEYPKSLFFDNSRNNYERKKKAFCGVSNLYIITPSKWLANLVKQSFLSEYEVKVVYNTIDRYIFKPTTGNFREVNNLNNYKIVLGVANIWGKRKGLDRYIDLAKKLPQYYKIVLVGKMTEKQKKMLPNNVLAIGETSNAKELAEIYTVADVFLCLSREDNYPTVNLEAEACGTPVITMDVGGCKETIKRSDSKVVKTMEEVYELLKNMFPDFEVRL